MTRLENKFFTICMLIYSIKLPKENSKESIKLNSSKSAQVWSNASSFARQQSSVARPSRCFNCAGTGHQISDCPKPGAPPCRTSLLCVRWTWSCCAHVQEQAVPRETRAEEAIRPAPSIQSQHCRDGCREIRHDDLDRRLSRFRHK